jgi:hypothetical protein
MTFYSSPCLDKFILKIGTIVLETFENQLRVTAKHVFWLLEESFSGSRALPKMLPWMILDTLLVRVFPSLCLYPKF